MSPDPGNRRCPCRKEPSSRARLWSLQVQPRSRNSARTASSLPVFWVRRGTCSTWSTTARRPSSGTSRSWCPSRERASIRWAFRTPSVDAPLPWSRALGRTGPGGKDCRSAMTRVEERKPPGPTTIPGSAKDMLPGRELVLRPFPRSTVLRPVKHKSNWVNIFFILKFHNLRLDE